MIYPGRYRRRRRSTASACARNYRFVAGLASDASSRGNAPELSPIIFFAMMEVPY